MTLLVLIMIQKKGHLSCGSIRALCTLRIICNTTSTICITNRNSVFPNVVLPSLVRNVQTEFYTELPGMNINNVTLLYESLVGVSLYRSVTLFISIPGSSIWNLVWAFLIKLGNTSRMCYSWFKSRAWWKDQMRQSHHWYVEFLQSPNKHMNCCLQPCHRLPTFYATSVEIDLFQLLDSHFF